MPIETLLSKGFPEDTPISSDDVSFRFAGNAVTFNLFTELFTLVCSHLEEAGVSKRLIPNDSQYSIWLDEPFHLHDYISNKGKLGAGAKKGHNIVHNVTRERE